MSFVEIVNTREVHDLLRHHPGDESPLEIYTSQPAEDADIRLTTNRQPDSAATLRDELTVKGLRSLLAHYPCPVTINGEPVERTPYDERPNITIEGGGEIEGHDKPLPECGRPGGDILFEGLLYAVWYPERQPPHIESDGLPRQYLKAVEKIGCLSPDLQSRYVIRHNLRRDGATEDELRRCQFGEALGNFNCIGGSPTTRAVAEAIEQARQTVRDHAASTGRSLDTGK